MRSGYLQHKRNLVMPLAIIGGAIFYRWMGYVTFLSPYLIFAMLFITYSRLSIKEIKIDKFVGQMLLIQLALSTLTYISLVFINHTLAEGVFICVFVPTATAAPVITSMLGGKLNRVVTYSLIINLVVALIGPIVLAYIGDHQEYTFLYSFKLILSEVAPLLLLPMIAAFILDKLCPKLHKQIANHQQLSFYIWAISLFIIVGGCVSFVINSWTPKTTWIMVGLATGATIVCILQFYVGRRLGRRFGDPVSGGQSLMQKNTVLAVWLAMTYMNPIASVGPAAYILCQNIVNSWQIARHDTSVKLV